MHFIKDTQVAEMLGVHRITVWKWAKANPEFPQPVQLGPRTTRWRLAEVEQWVQNL